VPIDTALVGALNVEYLEKRDVAASGELHHVLFQTSTIDALLDGRYDGDVTFAELARRGDFGLGTVDALDGEMIALDGDFYQVRADGRAYALDGETKTPFAVVTYFEPNVVRALDGPIDFAGLQAYLDDIVGDRATLYAVRVDGSFDFVRTRSVPRQCKPYPPLVEVVENQPTFDFSGVRGSLIGFRFPDYVQGLNVSGYHFHFITEDRSAGGHLLECRISEGTLSVDHETGLSLELPDGVDVPVPDPTVAKKDTLDRIERQE
jgi:acetolactate decarboxylase